jgi:RNA polymerase sigma-70 factor (ECF subfamily)
VWSLCTRLAPGEAEDAYQQIWEKVLRALPGFDPDGSASLDTWIGTIARRTLIDRHRRRRTRGEIVELDRLRSAGKGPESLVVARERVVLLERALQRLPGDQRRVVVLHHLQGVPLATLAHEEGVALGTIKSRLHRGRARLASILGGSP